MSLTWQNVTTIKPVPLNHYHNRRYGKSLPHNTDTVDCK